MSEFLEDPFKHRESIVEHLRQSPTDRAIDEQHLGYRASEIVHVLSDETKYIRRHLAETTEAALKLHEGSPRHWFVLMSHPEMPQACVPVEFGLGTNDITTVPADEVRFEHELRVDSLLHNNKDAATALLFSTMGADIARRVHRLGHTVFAGLEIQYAPDKDQGTTLTWGTLVYSRGLLETSRLLRETKKPASWKNKLGKPQNSLLAAEKMAVSGLIAARF